jgi:hypothetical protein
MDMIIVVMMFREESTVREKKSARRTVKRVQLKQAIAEDDRVIDSGAMGDSFPARRIREAPRFEVYKL